MISNRQASVFDTPFLHAPTAVSAIQRAIDAASLYNTTVVGTPMLSGTYVGSQLVALTSAQGATIRYTTNGSMPNASSLVYAEPLDVSTASTIKAVAMSGNTSSSVATRTYGINPRVLLPWDTLSVPSRGWQLARFAPQNNDFTYSVDVVPTTAITDAIVGLAWEQNDKSSWLSINALAYRNLLCRIRFFLSATGGRLEAYYGNGTGAGAYYAHAGNPLIPLAERNPDIASVAGSTYTIVFSVQYAAQTYGVTVAVNGGAPQVLAVGYPWNCNPPAFAGYVPVQYTTYIPTFASFNTLAMYAYRGGVQVRNNRLLSGVGVSPALPQTMGWQALVLAENAPDNIVSTEGTLVTAKRFGDSNPVTVNGVIFQGNILSNGIGTALANYAPFVSPGTASAPLQDLYDSFVYDTSSIHHIAGLTIGTTYMLQWFFAEERALYAALSQTVTIAGYTINLSAPLKAAATKCYFVATATSQDITISMGTTLPQIMAFQVRQISGIGVAASLSASPTSITPGSSTTLAWSTSNATATSISQGVISFSGGNLFTAAGDANQLSYNLYQPLVSSNPSPTGIFAAVPAATAATFATANLYMASATPISNFIQFTSGGIAYSFNLTKSEVIYRNLNDVDNMILRWTGSISAGSGPLSTPTPAICIITGSGSGSGNWKASLTVGPVGPFAIGDAYNASGHASTITVPIAGGSIAVAPSDTTTYSILAVDENGASTTASATVTVAVNVVAPSALTYSSNPATYTNGTAITNNTPSSSGDAVVSYAVSPALPAGLTLNTSSGVISGTPTTLTPAANYTITATNTGGSTPATVSIAVNAVAPSALSYSTSPAVYTTNGTAITNNTPNSSGDAVVSYAVSPDLPAGLTLSTTTGVISGTPTNLTPAANYTITATNTGGSTPVTLSIAVNAVAPSALTYSSNPAIYTTDTVITNNTPSSSGGAVVSYAVSPTLPTGLTLNTSTGVISGTPTVVVAATNYTITATNTGGSTPATVSITANATTTFNVSANGAASYTINGSTNPTLNLTRGLTYTFNILSSGHPLWIQTVPGGYNSGNIYSTGVTNNGATSNTITFVVPNDAPSTLYYNCQLHTSMRGQINITGVVLGWGEAQTLVNAPDIIVDSQGVLVNAFRFGNTTNLTINNVTFTGTNTNINKALTAVQLYPDIIAGSASASMKAMLRSLNYELVANTRTLTGLTQNRTYMLQWFFSDNSADLYTHILTIGSHIKNTVPTSKTVKCYFVATDTTMQLTIEGNDPFAAGSYGGHIQAYQIRDVTDI